MPFDLSENGSFFFSNFRNQLTDDDDCLDYLMKQPHIMPRLNDRILKDEDSVFLDYTGESLPSLKLEHFGALNRQVNQLGVMKGSENYADF